MSGSLLVATKRLAAVEQPGGGSNQHEFNGVGVLAQMLGTPEGKVTLPALFARLSDDGKSLVCSDELTWYDARRKHPTRSELRLYYPRNPVTNTFRAGDLLIMIKTPEGRLSCAVVSPGTDLERKFLWLLGVNEDSTGSFSVQDAGALRARLADPFLEVLSSHLELLGVRFATEKSLAEEAKQILRLESGMPSTLRMSELARERVSTRVLERPDDALAALMASEEALFRALERELHGERAQSVVDQGLDAMLDFSMSLLQARKARAGAALQHHFAWLLSANHIPFTAQGVTEGKKRPDFLIPGNDEYRDATRDSARLAMVATKTTCKDRWRQILNEADRIPSKHLLTLEPAISHAQLSEMETHAVRIVLPASIHESFDIADRPRLRTVAMLLDELRQVV